MDLNVYIISYINSILKVSETIEHIANKLQKCKWVWWSPVFLKFYCQGYWIKCENDTTSLLLTSCHSDITRLLFFFTFWVGKKGLVNGRCSRNSHFKLADQGHMATLFTQIYCSMSQVSSHAFIVTARMQLSIFKELNLWQKW